MNKLNTYYEKENKDDKYIKEQEFFNHPKINIIEGGSTRAKSVLNALDSIQLENYDYVLTHDVARPNIKESDIKLIIDSILNQDADCMFFYTPIKKRFLISEG